MKRLLYIGVHEVLEFEELKLFTQLGYDVFSYQGAYMYPGGHPSLKRQGVLGLPFHPELIEEAMQYAKTKIPKEFFDKFDAVMIMHDPNVVIENWERMSHLPVIWRSIGQSTEATERLLAPLRKQGLKIVRMSQYEENIVGYLGSDALIPFYKDKTEWGNWNGNEKRLINFTQSLKGRRDFCHYDAITQVMQEFPALVYGSGNTDLGGLDGGELTDELQKGALRDNRVFVYGGTWPSPYTLALQEAMMTGIPVVAIGRNLAENINVYQQDKYRYYQIPDIIQNEENGFVSDSVTQLRDYARQLMEDHTLAKRIGDKGRETAIALWDKDVTQVQWKEFFDALS